MRTEPGLLKRVFALTTAAAALWATTAVPRPAEACGGFFCNQPVDSTNLPVAQTAENVLFAMDRSADGRFKLEAHVQIFYTGPADRFSWVVPVDSQPELGVGSNAVFTMLLPATQPRSRSSGARTPVPASRIRRPDRSSTPLPDQRCRLLQACHRQPAVPA